MILLVIIRLFFTAAFLFTLMQPAWAKNPIVQPVLLGPSRVKFPAIGKESAFIADVSQDSCYSGDWPEDHFLLELENADGETLSSMQFSSSYEAFRLSFVDLTGDGKNEVILIRGEGRGTCAMKEYLEIYKRNSNGFVCILKEQISDYFGATGLRWQYVPEIVSEKNRPVTLRLKLSYDDYKGCELCSPELIPSIKKKDFIYDSKKGAMTSIEKQ